MPVTADKEPSAFALADGRDPIAQAAADNRRFHASAKRELDRYRLRGSEQDELLTASGYRAATERLLASNKRLRKRATELLIAEFGLLRLRSLTTPQVRFWHFSFLGPIITEYKPQLDVDAFRQVIYRLLKATPLNALLSIELQPLTNYPQRGQGRGFLLNAHALTWTDDVAFDAEAAAETMKNSGALHSELGAATVTCTPRTLDQGEIEWLGYYLLKAPADGKRRYHDADLQRWTLKKVAAVRSDLQLRLMEILSQLEFTDLVHGIRDGTRLRSSWKKRLSDWNKTTCEGVGQPLERDFDMAELWQRVRRRESNGSHHYKPIEFFGPRPRPIASERLPRASGKRLRPHEPRILNIDPEQADKHAAADGRPTIRLSIRDM